MHYQLGYDSATDGWPVPLQKATWSDLEYEAFKAGHKAGAGNRVLPTWSDLVAICDQGHQEAKLGIPPKTYGTLAKQKVYNLGYSLPPSAP